MNIIAVGFTCLGSGHDWHAWRHSNETATYKAVGMMTKVISVRAVVKPYRRPVDPIKFKFLI
uniref:Uncharacterized protein n=1 Tax=Glossina morsitans morsitans TaxID=37546 RepID=A0ABK9NGK0_GLOMM